VTAKVIDFATRKKTGDEHEANVRRELERRGWVVTPGGLGTLHPDTVRALTRTDSMARNGADFVVSCGSTVRYVDAKGCLRSGHTDRLFVNRRSIAAGLRSLALDDIAWYFVFDDLGVATPAEVMKYAEIERLGSASGYVAFPRDRTRPIDEVFGPVHVPTWGANPLFNVAA
jgi:hypothetical protein